MPAITTPRYLCDRTPSGRSGTGKRKVLPAGARLLPAGLFANHSSSRMKESAPKKVIFLTNDELETVEIQGSIIGTLSNFSASIGKAKSKKTFNVSAIVAAALKNGTVLRYAAELPPNKRKILYVDTEQSPYHCLKVARRILRLAGLPTNQNHENLEFLALRKYTPEERIEIVRQAIYRTDHIGLVVIDGIRDMVYDINSPSESTHVISLLMTWTDERQIHIRTILHQNKGDENARGHLSFQEEGFQPTKTGKVRCLS